MSIALKLYCLFIQQARLLFRTRFTLKIVVFELHMISCTYSGRITGPRVHYACLDVLCACSRTRAYPGNPFVSSRMFKTFSILAPTPFPDDKFHLYMKLIFNYYTTADHTCKHSLYVTFYLKKCYFLF